MRETGIIPEQVRRVTTVLFLSHTSIFHKQIEGSPKVQLDIEFPRETLADLFLVDFVPVEGSNVVGEEPEPSESSQLNEVVNESASTESLMLEDGGEESSVVGEDGEDETDKGLSTSLQEEILTNLRAMNVSHP